MILSQIVRGAAEELASRPGELVDPILVSAAFARAADAAYASVRDPAEGTMLSAVRAMAARVAHDLAHMDTRRLGPDATAEEQDELLAEVLENALEAGKEAVERGPEQLADPARVRRGRRGRLRADRDPRRLPRRPARRGRPAARAPVRARRRCTGPSTSRRASATAPTSPSPARASRRAASRRLLEDIGDSVLVVGDDRTLRVHVHTDEPDRAVALFEAVGEVSRFDVADMHEQVADRNARLLGRERRDRRRRPARSWRSPAARG